MIAQRNRGSLPIRGAAMLAVLAVLAVAGPGRAAAQGFVPISGAGSTWSFNALDQWRRNVDNLYGITVAYSPSGSSDGRNQFKNGTVDFAVSEIEYGLTDGGVVDYPPSDRGYAYMPIVAGGTSFMYNLKIGNTRVTNLRLSGEVIARIFTKKIKTWDDAAIKADNPGLTLPARPIVPVVRSDGSGTTAQFTRWLASQHGGIWDDYCRSAGRATPCGHTSNYPLVQGMEAKAQSQGVAGFVAQNSSEGAITYVEYSYAKNAAFPVAKVLNAAGYYIEPTASSVAVALLKAGIRADLTQELNPVYVDGDRRTYPLSSYSYLILPTDTEKQFSDLKGRTLSEFAYYFLCEGQQQADALGYSPLPLNLVQAGVDQVNRIPGATGKLRRDDLQRCNNPTFSPDGTNLLARNAPQPPDCDRKGPQQCATGTGGAKTPTPTGTGNNASGAGAGTGAGGNANNNDSSAGTGTGTDPGADPGAGGAGAQIDPDTGQPIGGGDNPGQSAYAVPVSIDVADRGRERMLSALAIGLLLALVLGPPLVARHLRQRGAR
jgi:phosphate ABC transporter phosphate-binding protein